MTLMNEEEMQAHSKKQTEMHTAAQTNFNANVNNIVSAVLQKLFVLMYVLSGLAGLYVVYGSMVFTAPSPTWLPYAIMAMAIVGVTAQNISYVYTNRFIMYAFGYYELLYSSKVLLPLRIVSGVFIILLAVILFVCPTMPILSGCLGVVAYFLMWRTKVITVPPSHSMFG